MWGCAKTSGKIVPDDTQPSRNGSKVPLTAITVTMRGSYTMSVTLQRYNLQTVEQHLLVCSSKSESIACC